MSFYRLFSYTNNTLFGCKLCVNVILLRTPTLEGVLPKCRRYTHI